MTPALAIVRTNTILYCERWTDTVAFYRDTLDLTVTHTTEWFVEVHLSGSAHLSLTDASQTSIAPSHGAGITLSWQVADLATTRSTLVAAGLAVTAIAARWNSSYVELNDPEGTRIELWSPTP